MKQILALVGNPNTGKTTLFNTISNSNEHVGNWHGVTVDIKEKMLQMNDEQFVLCDLPGIYSLTNYSYEEAVTKEYLYNNNCKIINICDANNIQRNLFLTLQLLEMGKEVVLCVNMKKEFVKSGKILDCKKLSKMLGIPVFFIDADNKKEVKNVVESTLQNNKKPCYDLGYYKDLPIKNILEIICNNKDVSNLNNITKYVDKEFIAIKLLEQDEFVKQKLNLNSDLLQKIEAYSKKISYEIVAQKRYEWVDKLISETVVNNSKIAYGQSKLDKILLNKYLCFPCFLLIMFLVFYLTFSSFGAFLTDNLNFFLSNVFEQPLLKLISSLTTNQFVISFFNDAILGGVCSVLGFLPQIVLLFLFLNLLEDSGYLSRLAFSLEDFFSKLGLSGKSVFSLLMSFGCSTSAAMTSRNLEDKNSKIKTAILTPYLSCSAKLPIYSVICGAFFVKQKTLVVFGLYLLGIVVSVLVSLILEKTILKSGEHSFILEFPPYRIPKIKRVVKNIITNSKQFLFRIGGVMLCFSAIIWIMQNCSFTLKFGTEDTILKTLGSVISPIFAPLGFSGWPIAATLICGIFAKEIIVSTMGIINNININSSITLSESLLLTTSVLCFSQASALSYLVFSLLYFPCMATIAVLSKEIGAKWTVFACSLQFVVAYIIAFITYKIYSYYLAFGIASTLISLLILCVIIVSIIFVKKFLWSKNKCEKCCFNNKCGSAKKCVN